MASLRDRTEQARGELRTIMAGASPRDRLSIARILTHAHLHLGRGRKALGWIPEGRSDARVVRLASGHELLVRPQDAIVLYEHFGLDVYDVELVPGPVRTIVDLGANIGYASIAMARRHPQARFVCAEPVAETRALLEENLRRNGVDAQVFPYAIAGASGRFAVDRSHYAAAHQLVAGDAGDVEGIPLVELLDRAGVEDVDVLKVDVEGAEAEIFPAVAEWAPRVRSLIGEVHPPYSEAAAERDLAAGGFRRRPLPAGVRHAGLLAFVRD